MDKFVQTFQKSAIDAVNATWATGRPITIAVDGWVVHKFPDGTIKRLVKCGDSDGGFWSAPRDFEPTDEYYSELMEFYDIMPLNTDPRLNQILTFGAILATKRQAVIHNLDKVRRSWTL